MTARSLSFGSAAAAYERYRPGYPPELVDGVLAYAGRPVRTALEIGAGTGKATRTFAARGVAVTAVEPDAAMLRELRNRVPSTVTVVHARFEDIDLNASYDLVFAAAAMHWTDPVDRWGRVAALLVPGATFACFGGQLNLTDPELDAAVREARRPFLESDSIASPAGTTGGSHSAWPGGELAQCGEFTDVRRQLIERRSTISAREFIGHLSTISAYLELPFAARAAALSSIRTVLPAQVDVSTDIDVHLARRLG